ncbi:MAG: aquaporin [Planctomycetota bacterium]
MSAPPVPTLWRRDRFFAEVLGAFALAFCGCTVILNVSTQHMEKGIMAGVAVGGFIALAALLGRPLNGASMNPIRSLAPAVAGRVTESQWIYLVAPMPGATLAGPTCRIIQGRDCCAAREAAHIDGTPDEGRSCNG